MALRRRPSRASEPATGEVATVELVRRLGTLLTELGLTELEVTAGDVRVRLQRGGVAPAPAAIAPAVVPIERPAAAHASEIESASGVTIEAPMVGTFYRASSPTADPYVSEGDLV
jgi:acetyl-CoA carboxylase biotin carboxyl carrier protein